MDIAAGTIDYSIDEVKRSRDLYHLRMARKSITKVQDDVDTLRIIALLLPYVYLWSRNIRAQKIQN
jgi:hypothetical protein